MSSTIQISLTIGVFFSIAVILVGFLFISDYLLVEVGTVDYGGFCMTDEQCKVNLKCGVTGCSCADATETFVNGLCTIPTSTALPGHLPMVVTANIFATTSPTKSEYNFSSTTYSRAAGICAMFTGSTASIYLVDADATSFQRINTLTHTLIAQKRTNQYIVACLNGDVYTFENAGSKQVVKYSYDLSTETKIIPVGAGVTSGVSKYRNLAYDSDLDQFYLLDIGTNKIHCMTSSFTYVRSITLRESSGNPYCVQRYNKETYVGYMENRIEVYRDPSSTKLERRSIGPIRSIQMYLNIRVYKWILSMQFTLFQQLPASSTVYQYNNICRGSSDSINSMVIDSVGNLYVSCFSEKKIYRYDASTMVFTNQYIDLLNNPSFLTIDGYGRLITSNDANGGYTIISP